MALYAEGKIKSLPHIVSQNKSQVARSSKIENPTLKLLGDYIEKIFLSHRRKGFLNAQKTFTVEEKLDKHEPIKL